VLLVRDRSVRPRDPSPPPGSTSISASASDPRFEEQVFFHEPQEGADGLASAAVVNRDLAFGAFVRVARRRAARPRHWKMTGEGEYVCARASTHAMARTRREQRRERRDATARPASRSRSRSR